VRTVLLLGILLLAGCDSEIRATMPVRPPDGLVVVFSDDFHSGIVLARADAPAELISASDARPWVAFHFGERLWITGEASGALDALKLGICTGDGGMQVDALDWWVHDRGGTDLSRERVWVFPVSAAALEGVRARLRAWIAPGSVGMPLRPGTAWWASSHAWSVIDNCHDFTAEILHGAGIEVTRPLVMLAGGLHASLDEAWALRDAETP
jgi:hypothetical protein